VPALVQTTAGASSVASLKAAASALAGRLNIEYTRLDILDEEYNNAVSRVSELRQKVAADERAIEAARSTLSADEHRLRSVAIATYVTNGADSSLAVLMDTNASAAPEQQAYLQAASSNIDNAVTSVRRATRALSVHRQLLARAERSAVEAQSLIAANRHSLRQEAATLQATLDQVKGRLASAVAAAQAASARAAAARAAAAAAAAAASTSQPPATPPPPPPVTGGGSGAVAVRAAESQLGVPYEWGGATPGVGFDCSGLTMWAWGQAGVQLAHGATDQYYEIPHVSMSDLQPGDLIFYGSSGYLYHVVMYVGSGPYGADTVIQAEQTGTDVMFTPIPGGAYGAGRP